MSSLLARADGESSAASIAYHEAGHAVAGAVRRLNVRRVTIEPTEEALGVCYYRSPGDLDKAPPVIDDDPANWLAWVRWENSHLRRARDEARWLRAHIVACFAGPAAERRFGMARSWDDPEWSSDRDGIS